MRLAPRIDLIELSPTFRINAAARALKAQGVDVLDFSVGEPDFPTPPHIIDAAYAAAKAGQTLYTGASGTPEVRAAVAGKFRRENGLDYTADDIVVANGAKQIIFNALMATLESGDDGTEVKYEIVFPEEVDPAAGLISIGSPLGRALLNREVGDEVEVATPKGKRSFQIVELRTIHDRKDMNAP